MNGRSSKQKGTNAEREIVNIAKQHGLNAQRAYASDGRSLGHTSDVDATINRYKIQVKRRAKIADYIQPPPGADITLTRENHGQWLAILPYTLLLHLIKNQK